MKRALNAIVLLLALPLLALAEEAASERSLSITISPLHLLNPELHVTGEARLAPKTGVAAMLGAGWITDEGETSMIFEVGGQFRYYLLGSFAKGLMLGADAGYVAIGDQIKNPIAYLAGLHAGGFFGFKYTMKCGFTAEAQLGPIYLWGATAETSEIQTLVNLKVGWSFK